MNRPSRPRPSPHPLPRPPPHLQDLLQLPRGLRPEQAGPGPLHLPPPGAAGGRGLPGGGERGGPGHGGHGALRPPVEPRAAHEEARGQDPLQGRSRLANMVGGAGGGWSTLERPRVAPVVNHVVLP